MQPRARARGARVREGGARVLRGAGGGGCGGRGGCGGAASVRAAAAVGARRAAGAPAGGLVAARRLLPPRAGAVAEPHPALEVHRRRCTSRQVSPMLLYLWVLNDLYLLLPGLP